LLLPVRTTSTQGANALSTATMRPGDTSDASRRGPGRPRDPSVEIVVRAAVRESLIEDGFEATTIPAVARRAGIGAPTIYRRWPTQIELVETVFDDIFAEEVLEVPLDQGDFDHVVRRVVEGAFRFYGHPAARRAVPGLLAAYNGDPSRYEALTQRIEVPARRVFRQVHANAVKQGRVARKPDPDTLFSTIAGSALYYANIRGETDAKARRNVIDVVLKSTRVELPSTR
jgi:AcrR family transcriptional regulator